MAKLEKKTIRKRIIKFIRRKFNVDNLTNTNLKNNLVVYQLIIISRAMASS